MPGDAPLRHLTARGSIFGIRFQEYYFRFVGVVIEQPTQAERSWPFWRLSSLDGDDIELVQVWYQRVSNLASPVFCDIRWHPEKGETVQLVNADNSRRMRDVTVVWRGRLLLQRLSMPGRPENTVILTKAEFTERAPQVCANLLDAFGKATDAQLAAGLDISRTTLYRYMDQYDLPLKRIRDMAVGLLIEPAPF